MSEVGSLATMQAGEVVSLLVTRTSQAWPSRSSFSLAASPANSVLAWSWAAFSASPVRPPRSDAPCATDCNCLPSNSRKVVTSQLSTTSASSSTSTSLARKASRCGLLRAAASVGASR